MSDGKVMEKYYPPDFDPESLKTHKDVLRAMTRDKQGSNKRKGPRMMEMRMMFPFTLECSNCKDFVYVGTKFNSKVERIRGEDYLGIALWRFYGRCPHCRNQVVMRTDPKNTDYILESGGSRTYDSNRDVKLAEEALEQAQVDEGEGDAARALEIKSYSTTEELKTLEALDELRRINKRLMGRPDKLGDYVLGKIHEKEERDLDVLDKEEMDIARELFHSRDFRSDSSDNETPDDSDHPRDQAEHKHENKNETQHETHAHNDAKTLIHTSKSRMPALLPTIKPTAAKFFSASLEVGPRLARSAPQSADTKSELDNDLDDLLAAMDYEFAPSGKMARLGREV